MENLRQPDQRLKIKLGPFGHHAVEYFAAVLLPCAIKTGKKFLASFWCERSAPRRTFFELALFLFLMLALARGGTAFCREALRLSLLWQPASSLPLAQWRAWPDAQRSAV